VLEAPDLIDDYLLLRGKTATFLNKTSTEAGSCCSFSLSFLRKDPISQVSIGPGLDIIGNHVNDAGNSLDAHGRIIDTRDYFIS
jgi:glycerol-3-phosphate O-acyltransferase